MRDFDVIIGLNTYDNTGFQPEIISTWNENLKELLGILFARKGSRPNFEEIYNSLTELYKQEDGPTSP